MTATFADRLGDAVNPIVVKELRQAVKGKFVSVMLSILLLIQLAAISIYVLTVDPSREDFRAGRDMFMILHGMMLGIALLFVPAYSAIRFAAERADTNVDLLFITTLRPVSIIFGKTFCALVISALIFSACLPFITFTYFLRGIDLPSIFVVLVMDFLVVIGFSLLAILTASLPTNRILKVFVGLVVLVQLPFVFGWTIAGSYGLISAGIGSRLDTSEFWFGVAAAAAVYIPLVGLLFVISVVFITPLSANRALALRGFVTAMWLLTGAGMAAISLNQKHVAPIMIWVVFHSFLFSLGFIVAVCEREHLGRRVTRTIPKSLLPRAPLFPLFSGSAASLLWSGLLFSMTIGVALLFERGIKGLSGGNEWIAERMSGFGLTILCYALTGLWVRRFILRNRLKPHLTWVPTIILIGFGSVITLFLIFLFYQRIDNVGWLLGNPFIFFAERRELRSHIFFHYSFLLLWLILGVILNGRWLAGQVLAFKPHQPENANA
jgi:hypothetical protein